MRLIDLWEDWEVDKIEFEFQVWIELIKLDFVLNEFSSGCLPLFSSWNIIIPLAQISTGLLIRHYLWMHFIEKLFRCHVNHGSAELWVGFIVLCQCPAESEISNSDWGEVIWIIYQNVVYINWKYLALGRDGQCWKIGKIQCLAISPSWSTWLPVQWTTHFRKVLHSLIVAMSLLLIGSWR